MKTKQEIKREIAICQKQLNSNKRASEGINSAIRLMLVEKIETLKWVLEIKEEEIVACCITCGNKKYPPKREVGAITMRIGICPVCKKKGPIVPASDWRFGMGNNNDFD